MEKEQAKHLWVVSSGSDSFIAATAVYLVLGLRRGVGYSKGPSRGRENTLPKPLHRTLGFGVSRRASREGPLQSALVTEQKEHSVF